VTYVTDIGAQNGVKLRLYDPSLETRMTLNIGGTERILRILAGLVLIGLAATGTVGWWGWLGIVLLATGAIGWCPPYALLGINTCSMKTKT
jgi:hypothetical protein